MTTLRDNIVFVDTGAWYALQVHDDRWHAEAVRTLTALIGGAYRLVTTTAVVGETYSLLIRTHGHGAAFRFVDALRRSERLEVVAVDAKTDAETYGLLRRFADQPFSYVDGTSFVVMRQQRMRLAFAFDHHFSIAGYVRVPLDQEV